MLAHPDLADLTAADRSAVVLQCFAGLDQPIAELELDRGRAARSVGVFVHHMEQTAHDHGGAAQHRGLARVLIGGRQRTTAHDTNPGVVVNPGTIGF
jgi:hypothetical protein